MWYVRCILAIVMLAGGCVGCGSTANGVSKEISIRQLLSSYGNEPRLITERVAVVGTVVSNDRYGEFRHKVIVEDATGGVTFLVACDSLYIYHKVGDRLRVECQGLTIGSYWGSKRIGCADDKEEVGRLSRAEWREHYTLVGVAQEEPMSRCTIGDIGAERLSTRLLFEGVEFVEAGEQWAPYGRDTIRHIIDRQLPHDTLAVRLSGRSSFAEGVIPEGECWVVGVLDYNYDHYELLLASPYDILECGGN